MTECERILTRRGGIADRAVALALRSPCAKSKRGAVVFHQDGHVVGRGWNAQPDPFECDGSELCRARCAKLCVHAEAAAIIDAGAAACRGAAIAHAKVVDERLAPSGPPSCWQCSSLILSAGIEHVWLFHADGWRHYSAMEFHGRTLRHHNF